MDWKIQCVDYERLKKLTEKQECNINNSNLKLGKPSDGTQWTSFSWCARNHYYFSKTFLSYKWMSANNIQEAFMILLIFYYEITVSVVYMLGTYCQTMTTW